MKRLWIAIPSALLLAGIIHVAAVLGMPHLAPSNAWERLAELVGTNEILVLPPATPEQQSLPLMAPDVRYAVCRFDISEGPVRLITPIQEGYWLIAFYTTEGENFYTISGAELKRDKIEFVISTKKEALFEVGASILDDIDDLIVVASPERTGIVVVRAPVAAPGYASRTEAAMQEISCSRKLTGIDRPG